MSNQPRRPSRVQQTQWASMNLEQRKRCANKHRRRADKARAEVKKRLKDLMVAGPLLVIDGRVFIEAPQLSVQAVMNCSSGGCDSSEVWPK